MGCRKTRNMQSKDQNRPGVHLVHPLYGPQTDGTNSQDVPTQWHCPILGKKGDSLQQMAQPKRKGKSATEIHPLIQKIVFGTPDLFQILFSNLEINEPSPQFSQLDDPGWVFTFHWVFSLDQFAATGTSSVICNVFSLSPHPPNLLSSPGAPRL